MICIFYLFFFCMSHAIYIYIYTYIQTDSLPFKKSAVPLNGSMPLFISCLSTFFMQNNIHRLEYSITQLEP